MGILEGRVEITGQLLKFLCNPQNQYSSMCLCGHWGHAQSGKKFELTCS